MEISAALSALWKIQVAGLEEDAPWMGCNMRNSDSLP